MKSLPGSNFAGKRFCLLPSSGFFLHPTKLYKTWIKLLWEKWVHSMLRAEEKLNWKVCSILKSYNFNWKVLKKFVGQKEGYSILWKKIYMSKYKCVQCCRVIISIEKFQRNLLAKKECIQCCGGGGWPASNFKLAACQNPNIYNFAREQLFCIEI